MAQNKVLRFFYLKVDNEKYNQKFKTFESARDFAYSVFEHMINDKKIVEYVAVYDHKNKKLFELSNAKPEIL
jgi:hypothetical protein